MSGLEVLAAVTSIVSAFNGSLSLYRTWRDTRADRASDQQNYQLDCSLYNGATAIQQEYDRCYARLGHRFSSGDEDARAELAQYVTYFQYALNTLVAESNSLGQQLPSVQHVLAVSEATRTGVVAILGKQYQRLTQKGSSHRAFLSPTHRSALRGSVACEEQRDVVRRGASSSHSSKWDK